MPILLILMQKILGRVARKGSAAQGCYGNLFRDGSIHFGRGLVMTLGFTLTATFLLSLALATRYALLLAVGIGAALVTPALMDLTRGLESPSTCWG